MSVAIPHSTEDQGVVPLAHAHLRALDGIRFIAAFTVLVGHGYWYVVLQQSQTLAEADPISFALRQLPALGVTLFFVLSGFVIHYNYHRTVGIGATGNSDFFIARFSRLYPLFFAVFAIDFVQLLSIEGYFDGAPRNDFDLFGALPFFLSLTQCWLFIPFDGHPLYEHYGGLTGQVQATGAMWSLSVEFLFYLSYPLFSVWLTRRAGRSLALFAAAAAAAGFLYYGWTALHRDTVYEIGLGLYGSPEFANQFRSWIRFYAPLGRISEFLLGAAAAQYYLSMPRGGGLSRLPSVSTWIAAALVLASAIGGDFFPSPLRAFYTPIIGVSVALFVLLSVVHPTGLSRWLSSPIMVKGGEASYSLYLLHFYTMHEWAPRWSVNRDFVSRVLIYLAGIAGSLVLARLVYLGFERPSRVWLRSHFRPLHLGPVLVSLFVATTLFSLLASLHVHAAGKIAP